MHMHFKEAIWRSLDFSVIFHLVFLCFNLAKEQFLQDALNYHNERRQVHGVPLLKLNAELTTEAEKYAAKLSTKSLKHVTGTQPQGETIYTTCDGPVTGHSVGEAWYENLLLKKHRWQTLNAGATLLEKKEREKECVFV